MCRVNECAYFIVGLHVQFSSFYCKEHYQIAFLHQKMLCKLIYFFNILFSVKIFEPILLFFSQSFYENQVNLLKVFHLVLFQLFSITFGNIFEPISIFICQCWYEIFFHGFSHSSGVAVSDKSLPFYSTLGYNPKSSSTNLSTLHSLTTHPPPCTSIGLTFLPEYSSSLLSIRLNHNRYCAHEMWYKLQELCFLSPVQSNVSQRKRHTLAIRDFYILIL